MYTIIITLKNGTVLEAKQEYSWGYEEKMNDTRTDYIQIGDFTISKKDILTIENIKIEEEK